MQDFSYYYQKFGEYGIVDQVNHPILVAKGLPTIKSKELVLFETGHKGWTLSLNRDSVDILLLSQDKIPVGTKLTRTDTKLSIPVGNHLLGMTVDPLGQPISQYGLINEPESVRPIDSKPQGIRNRVKIKRPFKTGVTIVDMMVPLGKGQKELIIGDRKTGKSAFLLHILKKQIQDNNTIAIYCAIGKKKSDIKYIQELLEAEKIKEKVILVATSSYDSPSTIFLAPFSAMAIAEYFSEKGKDVVLLLDDLSTHAKFYRELSLVAKNFPGRDSYPGDIFYTHARLLERAGNFRHPTAGETSITCFPVCEIVEGDLTGYIQTNLMGITDGHIFFDSDIFYKGRRPAVNVQLSVTRAGKQTQSKINRDITHEVTSFLSLYEKMQNLSHFGSELTPNVKRILNMGDNLLRFFEQPLMYVIPEAVEHTLFGLVWLGLLEDNNNYEQLRSIFINEYEKNTVTKTLFDKFIEAQSFNDMLQQISLNKDRLTALWKKSTE